MSSAVLLPAQMVAEVAAGKAGSERKRGILRCGRRSAR